MMTPENNDFTPEELDTIHRTLWGYLHEGVATEATHTKVRATIAKIERLQLLGQTLQFTHKDIRRKGVLKEWLDWEGIRMARMRAADGSHYIVGENDIEGS